MNCQEYRVLIEDMLDTSLRGEPESSVKRHLEHCEACRAYLETRRQEHVAIFTSINAACVGLHLPEGFADRLAESVRARQTARRGWRRLSLPRWALIAASLALMAGFVFASVKWSMVKNETTEAIGTNGTAGTTETDDVPVVSSVDSTPSISSAQPKGEATMNTKQKAAAAALTAAMAAAPLGAANGDGYQYIDPTTYPAANYSYATSSPAITLNAGAVPAVSVSDGLEARSRSSETSVAIALETTKLQGSIISIR